MESILRAVLSQIDENALQVISRQANASPAQTQNAIRKDHNGSIFDNLGAVLSTPNLEDGAGILRHVLGNRQENVVNYISSDSGLNGASVTKILQILAPIVLGFLGKKSSGSSGGVIGSILNSYLKTETKQSPKSQSVINQILDRDNDGNIADDIAELGTSFLGRLLRKR